MWVHIILNNQKENYTFLEILSKLVYFIISGRFTFTGVHIEPIDRQANKTYLGTNFW